MRVAQRVGQPEHKETSDGKKKAGREIEEGQETVEDKDPEQNSDAVGVATEEVLRGA